MAANNQSISDNIGMRSVSKIIKAYRGINVGVANSEEAAASAAKHIMARSTRGKRHGAGGSMAAAARMFSQCNSSHEKRAQWLINSNKYGVAP